MHSRDYLERGVAKKRLRRFDLKGMASASAVPNSVDLSRLETIKQKFKQFESSHDRIEKVKTIYLRLGTGIWEDVGPYKTGYLLEDYSHKIPDDIHERRTGTFIDGLLDQLSRTSKLTFQETLVLAAYFIHWRHIRWQAGAQWLLMRQMGAIPAENNLAWQWVASTNASRPFFYNIDFLNFYGFCTEGYDNRPFEGSMGRVSERLFPQKPTNVNW